MLRVLTPLALAAALAAPALAQEPAPAPGPVPAPAAGRPAPTPEMIAARQAAHQACAADMAKLCVGVEPGHGGMMQCVRQHRAELSPGCSQALGALRDARRAAKG